MKIGVVGLGLIGGSIYKKLKLDNKHSIIGISRSIKGEYITSDYSVLSGCELVFVCTPMNKTLDILNKLEEYLDENTLVTDVSSLKEYVSKKEYKFKFIPSHPMAGTEFCGWDNSFPELFENAIWAITPKDDNNIDDYEKLKSVIIELGAEPVITTPQEHDTAVALISHAPMLIAQALCKNIEDNALAQKLASSGFRDTTRLALSNTEMANDMVSMNNENIKKSINKLNKNIENLLNDSNYLECANKIKEFRTKLYQ